MPDPYRLGAVVYHPKVQDIWTAFSAWFGEQGFPLAARYFDSYDEQLERCSAASSTPPGTPTSPMSKPSTAPTARRAHWRCATPTRAGAA
jgi:hypothetical protein